MRILRDDFDGTGAWDTSLWPYTQYQDSTGNFRPTRVRENGLGVVTNYAQDYGYIRSYFGSGAALGDYGYLVRGRFTADGNDANVRFSLRAKRTGSTDNDWTYPSEGYHVFFSRANTTVTVQKTVTPTNNSTVPTTLGSFTLPATLGTAWWNLRLEMEGTELRVKLWSGDLSAEPSSFTRTYSDSSISSGEPCWATGYVARQVTQLDFFETYDFFKKLMLAGTIVGVGAALKVPRKILAGSTSPGMTTGMAGGFGTAPFGSSPFGGGSSGFGTAPFGSSPFGSGTNGSPSSISVRRIVTRFFGGSITPGGSVRRAVLRVLGGSIKPSAIYFIGNIQKRLGGSITASQPNENAKVITRRPGGTLAMIGQVIVRSVGRIDGAPGIVEMTVRVAGQIRSRARRG